MGSEDYQNSVELKDEFDDQKYERLLDRMVEEFDYSYQYSSRLIENEEFSDLNAGVVGIFLRKVAEAYNRAYEDEEEILRSEKPIMLNVLKIRERGLEGIKEALDHNWDEAEQMLETKN